MSSSSLVLHPPFSGQIFPVQIGGCPPTLRKRIRRRANLENKQRTREILSAGVVLKDEIERLCISSWEENVVCLEWRKISVAINFLVKWCYSQVKYLVMQSRKWNTRDSECGVLVTLVTIPLLLHLQHFPCTLSTFFTSSPPSSLATWISLLYLFCFHLIPCSCPCSLCPPATCLTPSLPTYLTPSLPPWSTIQYA